MRELALFAGVGGGILGGHLLGWCTRCAVEIDPYCRSILLARQRDGVLPQFPIWDDVCTFAGGPWRGYIDVITAGFPCQDISSAGKREGLDGARSGLWREAVRIVGEVRPTWILLENSPLLRSRGLTTILTEIARMGYDARWGVLGARHVGAPHKRDRIWIVAHSNGSGERALPKHDEMAGPSHHVCDAGDIDLRKQSGRCGGSHWSGASFVRATAWDRLPDSQGMDDGVANRMERIKATGNGQIPAVAALAWRMLAWETQENEN
jgi:DNA (cytosine-5)-methyltransferase 1